MISSITHGVGDNVCVCVSVCMSVCVYVCVCTLQQTFIVQRGPLPWLQGFIALKNTDHTEHLVTVTSLWQSCRLKQTETPKWCDDDERRCKADREELSALEKVIAFTLLVCFHQWWQEKAKHSQFHSFVRCCNDFPSHWSASWALIYSSSSSSASKTECLDYKVFCKATHAEYFWSERQTETHFATTNADKGAIRPEQSTALGFARSPLASLSLSLCPSLWPEIMWSDYAHGSSDVFPEEFDSDGGREGGRGGGRRATGYHRNSQISGLILSF